MTIQPAARDGNGGRLTKGFAEEVRVSEEAKRGLEGIAVLGGASPWRNHEAVLAMQAARSEDDAPGLHGDR